MRRPFLLSLLIYPTGLMCAGFVIWVIVDRHVRYAGMASWYVPLMVSAFAAWTIAMFGLLKMKKWAAILAFAALLANQFGHLAIGLWRVEHLAILLGGVPIYLYWEKYT